jgi:hypothetical protein
MGGLTGESIHQLTVHLTELQLGDCALGTYSGIVIGKLLMLLCGLRHLGR